jgi:hypothetical protein
MIDPDRHELMFIDPIGIYEKTMDDGSTAPACRLDEDDFRVQLARYRQISHHVETIQRDPGRLVARLGPEVPRDRLERALEVERSCCPFIGAEYDADRRCLTLTVEAADQDPALDALSEALSPRSGE